MSNNGEDLTARITKMIADATQQEWDALTDSAWADYCEWLAEQRSAAANDLTAQLAKVMYEADAEYMNAVQGWSLLGWDRASELNRKTSAIAATAALAHLQSAGRLVPTGGMALTAEEVEDVRTVLEYAGGMPHESRIRLRRAALRLVDAVGYPTAYLVQELRKSLAEVDGEFPATEPAADAKPCGSNSVTLGWCKLTARHEGLHTNGTYLWGTPSEPDPPAPSEPAEERCQSVSIFRERCALVPGHDGRHAANGCAWGYPPAPAEPAEEETKAEGPQTFRKKPVDIEAMQYDGEDWRSIAQWMAVHGAPMGRTASGLLRIHTLEGEMTASPGDWIIRGVQGEFYPCKPDIFAQTYDSISSPVVPAPTETGPWQTVDAIPGSLTRIKDCEGDVWHRCTAGWEHGGLHGPEGYAPFVAAEEG